MTKTCSAEGCDGIACGRGYCNKHLLRMRLSIFENPPDAPLGMHWALVDLDSGKAGSMANTGQTTDRKGNAMNHTLYSCLSG
jgi:hypothetical protein